MRQIRCKEITLWTREERERGGGGSLGFNGRVFWKMYNAHFAK